MHKRSSRESDGIADALRVVETAIGEKLHPKKKAAQPIPINARRKKNPAAVALGRLGGLKGGKARMDALSPERRRQIASNAARARWAKEKQHGD